MAKRRQRRHVPDPTPTTIASLPDELLRQILLRLPSPASVARAAAASRFLRDAISAPDFRGSWYLSHHASSSLLGFFVSGADDGEGHPLPLFQPVPQVGPDRDLAAAVRGGDFFLANLDEAPQWRLDDCLGGRLLLSRGRYLAVCEPLSRRLVSCVCRPRLDSFANAYFAHCLLRGHGNDAASFRVLSVQCRIGGGLQASEYDPSTGQWRSHPWEKVNMERLQEPDRAMHAAAAGLIFWGPAKDPGPLLLLDTNNMSFSDLALPMHLTPWRYSIGEMGDGACCLIASVAPSQLRAWLLGADNRTWELNVDIPMSQTIGRAVRACHVCAVASGVAFLQSRAPGPLFVVDTSEWCLKAEMEPKKGSIVYPFEMPWLVMTTISGKLLLQQSNYYLQ